MLKEEGRETTNFVYDGLESSVPEARKVLKNQVPQAAQKGLTPGAARNAFRVHGSPVVGSLMRALVLELASLRATWPLSESRIPTTGGGARGRNWHPQPAFRDDKRSS